MKKALLIILSVILMIGACGCGMSIDTSNKDKVLHHLSSKYNEDFFVVSYEPANLDDQYATYVCENNEGTTVTVYVTAEDKEIVIKDNYYGTLVKEEYTELLRQVFDKYLPEYKLFSRFTASYYDNSFVKDTDIEDAVAQKKRQFFTRNFIFISEEAESSVSAEILEKMCSELKDKGYALFVEVNIADNIDLKDIDEGQDVDIYLSDDYSAKPYFSKTVN